MRKHQRMMRRRSFLLGLGAFTTAASASCSTIKTQTFNNPDRDFSMAGTASLHERALAKGLTYGAFSCTNAQQFVSDRELQNAFLKDCGLMVGGFYWSSTRPTENTFDWSLPNPFYEFAVEHNKLFRGHPLVWHKLYPNWMGEKLRAVNTKARDIEAILDKHISTIVRRYAGKAHSWDVVNEAIKPEHGRDDGLRATPWLYHLGPDYIDLAFRIASEADPKALLVYNEYGLEYDNRDHRARRSSTLKLLESLKAKGTPVHALGTQSHLRGDQSKEDLKQLRSFLSDVASLGLKILVTELDVQDAMLPRDPKLRDRIVAGVYEDYLSVVLDEPAVTTVITWGLSDRYTWLSDYKPRDDGAAVRPLPLDDKLNRKLAWNAIARAFDQSPKR